jgi:hypothetical protein
MMLGISRRKMYKKKFGKSQMSRRRKMCRNLEKRFGNQRCRGEERFIGS